MPHPVARPTTATPTRRTPPTRRKGRRGLALLVGVAAASVAVLGFLQLTGARPARPTTEAAEAPSERRRPRRRRTRPRPGRSRRQGEGVAHVQDQGGREGQGRDEDGSEIEGGCPAGAAKAVEPEGRAAEADATQDTPAHAEAEGGSVQALYESRTERVERHHAVTGSESDHRGSRDRTEDTAVRLGSGGRGNGIPRRVVQGGRPRAGAGDDGARPRARLHLALRGQDRTAHPGHVSLVRLAGDEERPRDAGRRPGEADGSVALSSRGRRLPIENVMGSAASTTGHRVDDLSRITPELVLVDPELSRQVRPHLPLFFRRRRPPLPSLSLHPGASPVNDPTSVDGRPSGPTTPTGS